MASSKAGGAKKLPMSGGNSSKSLPAKKIPAPPTGIGNPGSMPMQSGKVQKSNKQPGINKGSQKGASK